MNEIYLMIKWINKNDWKESNKYVEWIKMNETNEMNVINEFKWM
jgi:hypothetical protein